MRERARAVGGGLTVLSSPGEGTDRDRAPAGSAGIPASLLRLTFALSAGIEVTGRPRPASAYTGFTLRGRSGRWSKARVYIVDEHEPVRLALADRLTRAAQIHVLGHSGNADEAIAEIRRTQPEIVLLEVKRSDGLGLELLRQVAEMPNPPKVLVLTSYPTEWEAEAATRAGAHSYLLKDIDTEELIRTIAEFAAE